jgi:transposase
VGGPHAALAERRISALGLIRSDELAPLIDVRLEVEDDLETVRSAALLLVAENKKLAQENLKLTRELLELKGGGPEQLMLKLGELEEKLAARNRALFGKSSEKRKRGGSKNNDGDTEPQSGHGPKEQPKLRQVELDVGFDATDEAKKTAETVCDHCQKPVAPWDGQFEESEEIDVISREFVVKKIRRQKARCECCRTIVTAPAPLKLVPGARYSIAFATMIVVSKYLDHLPLERQVKMMARDGLDVESQTLWDYVWAVAQLLKPAHARLLEYVLAKPVIGADETWWRLMGADKKKDGGEGDKWWLWSACADDAVCYRLEDSRSAAAGKKLLLDFNGTVMCDGYGVYSSLAERGGRFRLAHCWSHVRRKFLEIEPFFETEAKQVIELINELYAIEALCPTGPPGDELREKLRAERSRPIVKKIEAWALSVQSLPQSGLRKAIEYMGGLWKGLTVFLDDPRVPLHNNATERALRGPVVGRKNHFGSRSRRGTEAAAILYSLVESAKLAGVDPDAYLQAAIVAALGDGQVPLPHEIVGAQA